MLYVFGFERLGVVVSDLYFVDPNPGPDQEGPERGVRMELRLLEQGEEKGSVYASRPIVVERPIWRVDLLESVDNPGSLDRAHHHPEMSGWEPLMRRFEPELSEDPVGWVSERLEDAEGLLRDAGIGPEIVGAEEIGQLRAAAPEIIRTVRQLLDAVAAGDLARPPLDVGEAAGAGAPTLVRAGWL
ncbi:MAG TPA: hypothetical protein VMR97_02755 [Acidimicrobiales bacterium]|nr:hypothetical protein [Acidimicrobiales bacterium]